MTRKSQIHAAIGEIVRASMASILYGPRQCISRNALDSFCNIFIVIVSQFGELFPRGNV